MFCYQCEQTAKGQGCSQIGVCGKDDNTATLQDLLVHALKGVSMYAHRAAQLGARDASLDEFVVEALFATLTNVNFDPARVAAIIQEAAVQRDRARNLYLAVACASGITPEQFNGASKFVPEASFDGLITQGKLYSIPNEKQNNGDEVANLQEMILYGIKGVSAYADHAMQLGGKDASVFATIHEVLDFLTQPSPSLDELLAMALKVGELNMRVMQLLDKTHTDAFGNPVPTPVRLHPVKGKAILVSGHDLADLAALLEQTKGTGIQVYTHGEMLPAHGYPKLKAYGNLAGNYGGAWQDQAEEFAAFPGAILMTSNCIQQPKNSYGSRIFTAGAVAWPGIQHVSRKDFSAVIQSALDLPGFLEDGPADTILTGFGHNAVLSVADKVIDAVKAGQIRHFFLIGGCDGARSGRDYYTQLAEQVPSDCVILTLACGKYRFNKLQFGDIGGIPRLLDIGQCNDAYSAIQIAVALAGAFNCGVNDLPLSLVLSWYEQKAVAILLTLLHLGIKNVRIGPTLPAFITPNVLALLQKNYNLMPVSTPEQDLAAILQ
ncbi:MAG: hydroxylamine reductase [Acidobacteriota bacterium]|nr:hydroxylamine reductase [Acidobacteriota bacterium]